MYIFAGRRVIMLFTTAGAELWVCVLIFRARFYMFSCTLLDV